MIEVRRSLTGLMLIFSLVIILPLFSDADPLNNWAIKDSGTSNFLLGVGYGNGTFVAVGYQGTILTSPEGVIWTLRTSGTSEHLIGVAYGNGTFVIVGGDGAILTSPDGVTWAKQTSGTSDYYFGVAYGNGTFVAVGWEGTILTSPDGVTWTKRTSGTSDDIYGVIYGSGTFVAVGWGGTILTSPDGVTWTKRTSGTSDDIYGVIYGSGTFVAVGWGGTILTSPDGVTWTKRTSGISSMLNGVAYGSGAFVAVESGNTILTSADGIIWTTRDSGNPYKLNGVAYGSGTFVAVGEVGSILQSDPLIGDPLNSWTIRKSGTSNHLKRVAYSNGTFVSVGENGTILTSPNGVVWTTRTSGISNPLSGVTYGNNTFVAVGDNGLILNSPDAITWITRISGAYKGLFDVTYGNNTFVAVGDSGTILTSSDGEDWTKRTSGATERLFGVAYEKGTFVAVASDGAILTSSDGEIWAARTSGTSEWLWGVDYGNNLFVTVGDSGTILTSPDGEDWTKRTSGTSTFLKGIGYGNLNFVAVGLDGTILTSSDGVEWSTRSPGTSNHLWGVAYGNSTFVIVGDGGAILQSSPLGELYDDFSGTHINKAKWRQGEFVREIDTGSQKLVSKLASSNPIVITSYPNYENNWLDFSDPNSVLSIQADVAIFENTIKNSGQTRAKVGGTWYNDGTSGGGMTGDIWAEVALRGGPTGLFARWTVSKFTNSDGTAWQDFGYGDFVTPISIGTTHTLYINYDNVANKFVFHVGSEEQTFGPTGLPSSAGNPNSPSKGLGTRLLVNDDTSSGNIAATFDNIHRNGSLYDDFSFSTIDSTKWTTYEFTREISGKKFKSKVRSSSASTSQISNRLEFVNPSPISAIQAKVIPLTYQNNQGAEVGARIAGYYYNDGTPGTGPIGQVGAQVRIGGTGANPAADWLVWRETDNNPETLASGTFATSITLGNTYTLFLKWDTSQLTFKIDGEEVNYTPATSINPSNTSWKEIGTQIYNPAGKEAAIEALFDDVMVEMGALALPGDSNGDGQTTIDEVQKCINQFLGAISVEPCNDLDKDGQVTIDEVQKVVNTFLRITP